MMPLVRLSVLVIMLVFTLVEARDLQNKKPKYQGIVETNVAPQSYEHGGSVNTPNLAKTAFLKEVEDNDMKGKERKTGSAKAAFEEKVKGKVSTTDNGHGILENSGATSSPWKRNKLDVICNHNVRTSSTITPPNKKAKKSDLFVAISADYKDPKSHPPRHN